MPFAFPGNGKKKKKAWIPFFNGMTEKKLEWQKNPNEVAL
jgi:hypothetical protein